MAEEIHELAVRLDSTGATETQAALDKTTETFERTADVAQRQSSRLDGFAKKWRGAMLAIVGGLTVASAGLLSKVPVVGDAMGGLETVIDSVALKIDEDLRPSMSEFTQDLFETSQKVDDSGGTLDGLALAIGGVHDALIDMGARAFADIFGIDDPPLIDVSMIVGNLVEDLKTDVDQMKSDWTNFTKSLPERVNTALVETESAFISTRVTIKEAIANLWRDVQRNTASGLNDILETIETKVNKAIDLINKLPNTDFDHVSTGRLDVPPARGGREGGDVRLGNIADRQRNTFADRQQVEITLDSQADRLLKAKLNQGPLNRGRQG